MAGIPDQQCINILKHQLEFQTSKRTIERKRHYTT